MVTECTLAHIMAGKKTAQGSEKNNGGAEKGRQRAPPRPEYLPPPTELPLRYCKHETQREEIGAKWTEADCLIDLLGGMARGGEQKKNKWHYVLATADEEGLDGLEGRKRKGLDVRERARMIPGVPIVYVKRSVMVLEELSVASERWVRGREKEKLREGIIGKRKRVTDDDEADEDGQGDELDPQETAQKTARVMRKAKGPNPLSVRKKKAKVSTDRGNGPQIEQDGDTAVKAKRRRKHRPKEGDAEEAHAFAMPA